MKLARTITHEARLHGVATQLDGFLGQVSGLEDKLGCLLIQLPPSLRFELATAKRFFDALRRRCVVPAVVEPRHATWFTKDADSLLAEHAIGRVAADPALTVAARTPGGDRRLVYFRLHGSPRMYFSIYSDRFLRQLSGQLRAEQSAGSKTWCIFDNTAAGGALQNALRTCELLSHHRVCKMSAVR